jgi:K(+)-stimulated pyrophosphate-energized sodium pump
MIFKKGFCAAFLQFVLMLLALPVFAGEADIKLPPLDKVQFSAFGGMSGLHIMYFGLFVCVIGLLFSIVQYKQTANMPAHKSMLDVSNIIW